MANTGGSCLFRGDGGLGPWDLESYWTARIGGAFAEGTWSGMESCRPEVILRLTLIK